MQIQVQKCGKIKICARYFTVNFAEIRISGIYFIFNLLKVNWQVTKVNYCMPLKAQK